MFILYNICYYGELSNSSYSRKLNDIYYLSPCAFGLFFSFCAVLFHMRWGWCRLFDVSCGGAHDACSWVTPHHQRSLMQGISKPQHTGTKIDALMNTSHSFSACRVQQNLTLLSWEQDIPKLGHAKSSGDVSSNDFSFGSWSDFNLHVPLTKCSKFSVLFSYKMQM